MSISGILIATALVGGTGLIIGILLGIAARAFSVEVNETEIKIREFLPGNNCGGCGYAGCDALAKAIAEGSADPSSCPVGGSSVAESIGAVLGVEVETIKEVAFVKCAGTCEVAPVKYDYSGNMSCKDAMYLPGNGAKACTYGCLGYGSCVKVCEFDAIHIVNGNAFVDIKKCVACGKCIEECPRNIIEKVPYEAMHMVQCSSHDKGKDVKLVCGTGCIGCKMCEKVCEEGAITVTDMLASINYELCTGCGACVEKCPVKIIR